MESQKAAIAELISPHVPLELATIAQQIVPCKRPEHGDLSFPCFSLTREHGESFGRNPAAAAKKLAEALAGCALADVTALGPYLNFRLDESKVAAQVLEAGNAPVLHHERRWR